MFNDDHCGAQFLLDLLKQRSEGLSFSLGDAGRGLVEAQHPGVKGQQAGQLDDAAGSGRQFGYEGVGVAAQAQEVDQVGGVGCLGPLSPDRRREEERCREQPCPLSGF